MKCIFWFGLLFEKRTRFDEFIQFGVKQFTRDWITQVVHRILDDVFDENFGVHVLHQISNDGMCHGSVRVENKLEHGGCFVEIQSIARRLVACEAVFHVCRRQLSDE